AQAILPIFGGEISQTGRPVSGLVCAIGLCAGILPHRDCRAICVLASQVRPGEEAGSAGAEIRAHGRTTHTLALTPCYFHMSCEFLAKRGFGIALRSPKEQ